MSVLFNGNCFRPLSYLDSDLVSNNRCERRYTFTLHNPTFFLIQILLCFSLSSPSSLKSVSDRWRSELRHLLPAVPVLLVGTKADLREEAMRRERKERRREERRRRRREEEGAETNSSGGSNASTSATSEATATVPPAMEVDGGEEEEENQKRCSSKTFFEILVFDSFAILLMTVTLRPTAAAFCAGTLAPSATWSVRPRAALESRR